MAWVIGWIPFRWLSRKLRIVVSSLWFRLMGAFTAVLLIILISVTTIINDVTQREFGQYLTERNAYIRSVLPTIVPSQRIVIVPQLPDSVEIPVLPEIPDVPALEQPPEVVEEVVREVIEQVVIEEVVVQTDGSWQPFAFVDEAFPPDSAEAQGLRFLQDVRERSFTAVLTAGLVAFVLGTLIVRQITRPMARLRLAAQAIAQGETGVRVPVKSRDEMGKVAAAFNRMAAEIESQEQVRKQMVADVAHELRTPLTVMKSNLEAMLDGLLKPTPNELQELHDEVERLSRMTEDLRLLSLADAGQLQMHPHKVDVQQLVETAVSRLTPLANDRSVQLTADLPPAPLFMQADSDRLLQALGNLLDNGIRHAPVGKGVVRVTAVNDTQFIHISISDNGLGIPAGDIPHLFERFWRGDKSRTRNGNGSGLGLSIVKQIVDLHQGHIQVISLNGTTFTLSLPLKKQGAPR